MRQHVEAGIVQRRGRDAQHLRAELLAQGPLVEDELDVEGVAEALLDRLQGLFGEALRLQRRMVDAGGGRQRAVADGVALHLLDLLRRVAELGQRFRNDAVDDLEVAAAGQLLVFHQGEVRLDAGGVAVHHQTDGAGRCDHGGLGVAVAVQLAQLQGVVPGAAGGREQFLVGALLGLDGDRQDRQALIVLGRPWAARRWLRMTRSMASRFLVSREGAELARHLRRGGIGYAGHDRGHGGAQRAALVAVIGQALAISRPPTLA